jgi:predicted permease
MGNAIVPAVLGAADPGILYKYLLFTLPLSVGIYSWGFYILVPHGEENGHPLKNLLNPGMISMAIGILLGLTNAKKVLPGFLITLIESCKVCMAPVAMILTGFIIGGYSVKGLLKDKKVYFATFLRLIVLPAILLFVLKLIGASNLVMTLALFAFATPLGMNTVVFPAAYGGETKTGAAMAAISHTLCVITIPLMYAIFSIIMK